MLMLNQLKIFAFCLNHLAIWIIYSVVKTWIYYSLYCVISLCCLNSNTTRLLPLQVTVINSSMCAVSSAPTSRWRPLSRTWWHDAPGSSNTPYPSPLSTQWVQHCFAWCWIWVSSSSSVYLSSQLKSAKRRNIVNIQRQHQPRPVPAGKSLASEITV